MPFEWGRKTSDRRATHARSAKKHFEEEEDVPTRRPHWGKGKRVPCGLVEGLLITGPAHGCFTLSLNTIVTGSHLAPGF